MSESLPTIYLARHGETEWSLTGQHTRPTDLPLTGRGQRTGRQLGERLKGLTFAKVFTSPLQSPRHTCEPAGFGALLKWIPICSNGITVNMRGAAPVTFVRSVRTGNCFVTVAREANHHNSGNSR
jgi:bisphosphoglycerate-dependent phosphoglycerate mutase